MLCVCCLCANCMNETKMTFPSHLTYTTQEFAYRNRSECNKKIKIFPLLQYWHKPKYNFILSLPHVSSSIFTHKFWNQSKTRKVTSVQKFVNMSTNNLSTSKGRIDAISSVFICFTYFFHFIVRLDAIYQVVSRVCGLCQNCRNVSELTFFVDFRLYKLTVCL